MKRAPPKRKPATTTIERDADVAVVVDAFRRILRELRLIARKTELATGLSPAQLFVLSVVANAPGCSVNDIAGVTLTDRSSVAAVVDRLLEQGCVTRRQAEDDKRRAVITATARGRRAIRNAAPAPTVVLMSALRELDGARIRGLAHGMAALTGAMNIANEPAGMLFEDERPQRRKR